MLIVGVGLIGGSLGAAVRRRKLARRVVGLSRNPAQLQSAIERGILDAAIGSPGEIPAETSLVVVCTPVTRIPLDVRGLCEHLPSGALITDAGSTKDRICTELASLATRKPAFIGSHPIAGSEKQGHAFADPELFAGRTCVVTPLPAHPDATTARVEAFWQGVGMKTERMTPAEHDRALARTSHVPHVLASVLAESLSPRDLPWVGSGFRDTTRVASGDPGLWTDILMENAAEVRTGLAEIRQLLEQYEQALLSADAGALTRHLETGKHLRDSVPQQVQSDRLGE